MPKFDGEVQRRGNSLQELGLREFQEYEVAALSKKKDQPNLDRLAEEIYSQEKLGENDIVKKPSIRDRAKMFESKGPKI